MAQLALGVVLHPLNMIFLMGKTCHLRVMGFLGLSTYRLLCSFRSY